MTDNNFFTKEEDFILIKLVRMFGNKKWKNIAVYLSKIFPDRPKNQKICKNRWFKALNPKINYKGWSLVEEYIFFESQKKIGNKWATISKLLPGRTDNNIKNHFYSTLRKNIRRFLKDKSNFSCLKDKIKTFYTMMYAREKFNELKKFYDCESNTVDLKKAKRIANSETVNFDDSYISELICKSNGSVEAIDSYLTNLCIDLIVNNSEISSSIFNQNQFDLDNPKDIEIICEVISNLVLKNAMNSCSKNLTQNKENFLNSNIEHVTDCNKNVGDVKKGDHSLSQSSEPSLNLKTEDKQLNLHKNKSEDVNLHPELSKKRELNAKLEKIQNKNKFLYQKSSRIKISNSHSTNQKLQNPTEKSAVSEDKINSLINNFTKNFTYDTNIFDNIKFSNYMSSDSSSPNNIISLMISKIFEEGNENNHVSNIFQNNNINHPKNLHNIREKVLVSLLDLNKTDPLINIDLMEKLQSVSDFGLFKSILEKIILNNIVQCYSENSDAKIENNFGDVLKNIDNSGRVDNFNLNLQNNYSNSNQIKNSAEMSNLNLNDNDVQKIFKKIEKIKKEKSNSNSNYLQSKTNRSSSQN